MAHGGAGTERRAAPLDPRGAPSGPDGSLRRLLRGAPVRGDERVSADSIALRVMLEPGDDGLARRRGEGGNVPRSGHLPELHVDPARAPCPPNRLGRQLRMLAVETAPRIA